MQIDSRKEARIQQDTMCCIHGGLSSGWLFCKASEYSRALAKAKKRLGI